MPRDDLGRAAPLIPGVELGGVLGAGGFGTVYKGRHRTLAVDVAVKVIDLAPADFGSAGLLQEAQLMARLDHPNLLRIYDAGTLDRGIYLVCEFMDDGSCVDLRDVNAERASDLTLQLLGGLQALHDARILHRDIKPANCLKRGDNRVKLADLGLATELRSGTQPTLQTAGTIPFMAPELFEDPPQFGPPSDLYALGMTLACFLLERSPFPRAPLPDMLPWILNGDRPAIAGARPDVPQGLSGLVQRMISPRIEVRPQSVSQALRELSAAETPAVADQTPTDSPRHGPWVLGQSVYSSSNWEGWAVSHYRTGAAGRLMRLRTDSPLMDASSIVLAAAERAARLDERHVVPVLDWGPWGDSVFVVTSPWGQTFDSLVRARGPHDELTSLLFARDVAEALAGIHQRGLVYQNVDPGSAVVAADARTAKLSWPIYCVPAGADARLRVLVPRYAAPEALSAATPTIETALDVFGLGALLLFLLTGSAPPRGGESVSGFVRSKAADVTAATAVFVGELLAADPAARPTSAEALARARELSARLQGSGSQR